MRASEQCSEAAHRRAPGPCSLPGSNEPPPPRSSRGGTPAPPRSPGPQRRSRGPAARPPSGRGSRAARSRSWCGARPDAVPCRGRPVVVRERETHKIIRIFYMNVPCNNIKQLYAMPPRLPVAREPGMLPCNWHGSIPGMLPCGSKPLVCRCEQRPPLVGTWGAQMRFLCSFNFFFVFILSLFCFSLNGNEILPAENAHPGNFYRQLWFLCACLHFFLCLLMFLGSHFSYREISPSRST